MNPSHRQRRGRSAANRSSAARLPIGLALTAAVAIGCRSLQAPSATVLPQPSIVAGDQRSNLQSATLRYATAVSRLPENGDQVVSAAFDGRAVPVTRQLLAIRYPHPDGRTDAARAELVVARVDETPPSGFKALSQSLSGWFSAHTPGVAWGDGITEAKALDISVAELQQAVAASQTAVQHGVRQAHQAPLADAGRLHLEINGELSTSGAVRAAALDALASRVARRGALITCRTSARELFADLPEAPTGVVRTAAAQETAADSAGR